MGHERHGMLSGTPMEKIGSVYPPVRILVGRHENPGLFSHCSSGFRTGPVISHRGDIPERFEPMQKSSMTPSTATSSRLIGFGS